MKAVISKADLVQLLGKIQPIVPIKPPTPILSNILVEAVDDQVIVSATDLTVSMRIYVDAKVLEEGAISLPARRFFQLVKEITSPQIKLHSETQDIVEITTGSSVFKVHGMSAKEFPALPDLSGSSQIVLSQAKLKEMFFKTAFSAAKEDSRYMLNGVQVTLKDRIATFIGTDGKRLARTETEAQGDSSLQGSYVIPLKAVEEMSKMLEDTDAPVHLNFAQDKVSIESHQLTLISKLLSGQYPDVERVIPKETAQKVVIHREELICLLRQVSVFTSEMSSSVRFSFETGQLFLAAMSSDIGEGRVSMPVDYAGAKLDIAFNPYFFLDILRHLKEETFSFGLNDPHSPGLITDSSKAFFVLMPMRLTETPAARQEVETSVS